MRHKRFYRDEGVLLWCPECDVISDDCVESTEHAGLWITLDEKARDEAEENQYAVWVEGEKEGTNENHH